MLRAYDAIVLDIDGTLLDDREQLSDRTRTALAHARQAGVVVMLATGRSHGGTRDIARLLELSAPCVVLNGAAVYSSAEDRLLECRHLHEALVEDLLSFALEAQLLATVARAEAQYAREPSPREAELIRDFAWLKCVPHASLPRSQVLRLTLFSQQHTDSRALREDIARIAGDRAAYYTHFPLAALAGFRDSPAQVVDVQPACAGKAEALRVLADRFGIPAARVVAVGDAGNDLPILQAVGLGVAMGNATPEVKRAAHRVIGDNDSDALAELIEELFVHPSR